MTPRSPGQASARRRLSLTTRRRLLGATGGAALVVGLGAVGRGGAGALGLGAQATPAGGAAGTPMATPVAPSLFREPPLRVSQEGLLQTSLVARSGPADIVGRVMTAVTFDGAFPGPTLRVRPGDRLRIDLTNELPEATNLHVHGLHVSPRDNGDNVFLHIMPGETFTYEYALPLDHPSGLYWYHPHQHGDSFGQVASGLLGTIIVEGAIDELPGIAGVPERLLVLQSSQLTAAGDLLPLKQQSGEILTFVNGGFQPELPLRPGQTERWRILNGSADNFLDLQLDGHQFHQIGADGNPLGQTWARDRLFLSPGERAEVLIQPGAPGRYAFRSLAWGEAFQAQNEMLVATMVVGGEPVAPAPLPTTLLPFEELTEEMVDKRRELVFQEPTQSPFTVAIDGKVFDPHRVDQTVKLGAVEEWLIRNTSPDWHPFHIHVNDFQVVAINGQPVRPRSGEDTVGVPPDGGEITIRTRFKDFSGKFVYHCHILGHEDLGMMGVVEVIE